MVKKHAQGFFVRCPGRRTGAVRIARAPVGRARGADRRPLPLRSAAFRIRSLPALRRHALRGLADARRAPRGERRRQPVCVSRCGRRMRRPSRWPASSTIGTRAATPCGGATAASGKSSCPGSREGASYKYNVRSRFAAYQQLKADPYAFYCELPPKSASRGVGQHAIRMAGRGVDDDPRRAPTSAEIADVGLRGPPRKLDARPDGPDAHLPRTGGQAGGVREADGLHPHRAAAGDGVSVLRVRGATR